MYGWLIYLAFVVVLGVALMVVSNRCGYWRKRAMEAEKVIFNHLPIGSTGPNDVLSGFPGPHGCEDPTGPTGPGPLVVYDSTGGQDVPVVIVGKSCPPSK